MGWTIGSAVTDESRWLRTGMTAAYAVLRERDPSRQRAMIVADMLAMLDASAVRVYEPGGDGELRMVAGDLDPELPPDARRMEQGVARPCARAGEVPDLQSSSN